MNLYGYTGNDPVNFIDPSGLECTPVDSGKPDVVSFRCVPDENAEDPAKELAKEVAALILELKGVEASEEEVNTLTQTVLVGFLNADRSQALGSRDRDKNRMAKGQFVDKDLKLVGRKATIKPPQGYRDVGYLENLFGFGGRSGGLYGTAAEMNEFFAVVGAFSMDFPNVQYAIESSIRNSPYTPNRTLYNVTKSLNASVALIAGRLGAYVISPGPN